MKLKRFTTQLAAAGLIALPLMAHAAGLGKLSVSSALGQPLSAEIELFAADQAELESLSASLASDQAFRDARVEYAPILSGLRFEVEKKAGNKAVLKVTTSRPVNDPFIDMLVELNWASGRLVREYTMLLDPPSAGAQQKPVPVVVAPVATQPTAAKAAATKPAPVAAEAPAVAETKPVVREAAPIPDSVVVRRGDTLAGIARRVRPQGVSLEQTLVGLYRENAKAFDGNMNRLRAGAKLNVPDAEKIATVTQKDARREIKLQADDWRAYRQKLADAVAQAPAPAEQATPGQAASGQITAKVDDRAKPAPDAQKDVLKLSKVTPPAAGATAENEARALQEKLRAQEEDALARERALKESGERVALLEKQVQDMQELVNMKEQALAKATPAPAPSASVAPVVQAPAPAPSTNWYDPLLANPLYWGAGAAVIGLGGMLWFMMAGGRRRKPGLAMDDSIMSGGDVRPNTVIGAASGGSVNTGDTSFLTDFSQAGLGTIDTHDVDPIAEAEVYMAYGRDAQAEEILKEAITKTPDRPEIRVKLLEIYAARRNTAAFEATAGELYAALGSQPGPLWNKACEMGRSIDPTNPLYGGTQKAAAADFAASATTVAATSAIAGGAVAMDTVAAEPEAPSSSPVIADMPESGPVTASTPLEFETAGDVLQFDRKDEPEAKSESGFVPTQGLDFDLADFGGAESPDELKLDLGLEADDSGPDSAFNFSDLDLDLGESGGSDLELDEVATKLDLARAYLEMGDKEGAREILNEVIAEGSDKQKADATGMLNSLG